MKNQKSVIVLGPPRSGTSLLGKILHESGVDMGNIRPLDFENPTGYYEDKDLLDIQDKIIKYNGSDYNGFNLPDDDILSHAKLKYKPDILSYINARKYQNNDIWGLKTTQTCLTLDLFLPYLKNLFIIVSMRNLYNIADSQVRYTKNKSIYKELTFEEALSISVTYYNYIFNYIKACNLPILFICYESLLKKPKPELKKIQDFLELDNFNYKSKAKLISSPYKIRFKKFINSLPIYSKKSYLKVIFLIFRNPVYYYRYFKSL